MFSPLAPSLSLFWLSLNVKSIIKLKKMLSLTLKEFLSHENNFKIFKQNLTCFNKAFEFKCN